jgi:hypothetical protein
MTMRWQKAGTIAIRLTMAILKARRGTMLLTGLAVVRSAMKARWLAAFVRNNVALLCTHGSVSLGTSDDFHHRILGQPDIPTNQAVGRALLVHGQYPLSLLV